MGPSRDFSERESATTLLEGKISVAAALRSPYRTVHRVLLRADRQDRALRWLQHRAHEANVPVEMVAASEIDAVTQGNSHGGAAAVAGQRRFVDMASLLPQGDESAFIVMLDGIEDPFNFGHALRALYAMGAHGLVLRPRNWMSAAATVAKASAGASELIPIAVAETVDEAAHFFRRQGLTVACAQKENAVPVDRADLSTPLLLLVGGEKRGVTRSFIGQADLRLKIPYHRDDFAPSLGTTAAAAALAYEVMRQRKTLHSSSRQHVVRQMEDNQPGTAGNRPQSRARQRNEFE